MKLWLWFVWCILGVVSGESASWLCSGGECPAAADEQFLNINGTRVVAGGVATQYARLDCGGLALDAAGLPRRAPGAGPLRRLTLARCAPPAAGLGAALAAAGVRGLRRLTLPAPRAPLQPRQLADLPPGLALELLAEDGGAPAALSAAALAAAPLHELRLTRVPLEPGALGALPPELRLLSLQGSGLAALPAAALRRLPALRSLSLREPALLEPPDLAGSDVSELYIEAPVRGIPLGAAVRSATVWGATGVELMGSCASLQRLTLGRCGGALPADWLTACPALEELSLEACPAAATLSAASLRGPRALLALSVRRAALASLPGDLLAHSPRLETLDVTYNALRDLPELPATLSSLLAAHNALQAASLSALAASRALHTVDASYNPLNDTCGAGAASGDLLSDGPAGSPDTAGAAQWARWSRLRRLSLRGVGLTRVCAAWRRAHTLTHLDLRDNQLTELDRLSLQWWSRTDRRTVDLRGNPLRSLRYSRADYERIRDEPQPEQQLTSLLADGPLRCDCGVYWAARAFRERPRHAPRPAGAVCHLPQDLSGRSLWSLPPRALSCPLPAARCVAGCVCVWRDAAVRAECTGNLTTLDLTALPDDIMSINASNLQLTAPPVGLTAAVARGLVLSLSHNPLACGCEQRRELLAASEQIDDWSQVRCADGSVPIACSSWRGWGPLAAVAASAVALAALLAASAALARRYLPDRLRGKLAALLPGDYEARPYDVFVAHAHADWAAAARVAAVVEAAGLRALLHWRDWPPGANIVASIERSVELSRRTVILLSPALADSSWVAAELQAASTSRLLPILLAPLPSDAPPELNRLVATKTYLHYLDARFEHKLVSALKPRFAPPRRPPPPPIGQPVDAPPPPQYITPASG